MTLCRVFNLAIYVRERKLLTLEEAVRKMSSFPARRLKLADRGLIREGMKADLVVFDPARVRDTATFENPHQYPEGIPIVIVNGEVVFENGAMTARVSILLAPAVRILPPIFGVNQPTTAASSARPISKLNKCGADIP